jgi:hypothetical protein
MDSGLHLTVTSVSGQTSILPTVIKFVDTRGNHINWTKLAATSCSHPCAGIRASIMTNSTKHLFKRNYLRLPRWAKTSDACPLSFAGKDFIDGYLNKSVFHELTNDRGSDATVDACAMVIVIRPLGWIITVEKNRIECFCLMFLSSKHCQDSLPLILYDIKPSRIGFRHI